MERKKLYRSGKNKIIAGIFGGVGEYFDIDPSLLRLFWVLIVVFTGFLPGIIAYLVSVAVVPQKTHKLE
ncbi:MAG: PspC domain-containing protein [Patescibacteria group bacterium]